VNHKVSFLGTGKGYFSVWIVNTLLKTVTLNVYSAWAKVRKRRYFAEKLFIDDEPFEYLAKPMALFRGWLIAAVAFVIYMVASHFKSVWAGVVMLVFIALIPWIVVKSRVFNARNHAFRNIRFGFAPKYGEAYRVMLGWPLLIPFTAGLLWPYVVYRQKRFFIENSSYGTTPFSFNATEEEFYEICKRAFMYFIGCLVVNILVVIFLVFPVVFSFEFGGRAAAIAVMIVSAVVYLWVFAYYKTAVANLVWNSTELGGMRFQSSMYAQYIYWLYLSGGVAVIFSFGLLFPWAAVRLMRYRCEHLTVSSRRGIGQFFADTTQVSTGALGEKVGDMFGLDFDIGF